MRSTYPSIRITRADGSVIYSYGLVSNETFTRYELNAVAGDAAPRPAPSEPEPGYLELVDLIAAGNVTMLRSLTTPYMLKEAAAPHIAAALEGVSIESGKRRTYFRISSTATAAELGDSTNTPRAVASVCSAMARAVVFVGTWRFPR